MLTNIEVKTEITQIKEMAKNDLNQQTAVALYEALLKLFNQTKASLLSETDFTEAKKELAVIVDKLARFLIKTSADSSDFIDNHTKAQNLIDVTVDVLPINGLMNVVYGALFAEYFKATRETKWTVAEKIGPLFQEIVFYKGYNCYLGEYEKFINTYEDAPLIEKFYTENEVRDVLKTILKEPNFRQQIAKANYALAMIRQLDQESSGQRNALYEDCYGIICTFARLAIKKQNPTGPIITILNQIPPESTFNQARKDVLFYIPKTQIQSLFWGTTKKTWQEEAAKAKTPGELINLINDFLEWNTGFFVNLADRALAKFGVFKKPPEDGKKPLLAIKKELEEMARSWDEDTYDLVEGVNPIELIEVAKSAAKSKDDSIASKSEAEIPASSADSKPTVETVDNSSSGTPASEVNDGKSEIDAPDSNSTTETPSNSLGSGR